MMPRLVDPGADLVGKTKRPDAAPSEPYRADNTRLICSQRDKPLLPARQASSRAAARMATTIVVRGAASPAANHPSAHHEKLIEMSLISAAKG